MNLTVLKGICPGAWATVIILQAGEKKGWKERGDRVILKEEENISLCMHRSIRLT